MLHDSRLPVLPVLLEPRQVAHRLSTSEEYVRRLLRDGQLAGVRFGNRWRVDQAELQRFIDAHRVQDLAHRIAQAERDLDVELARPPRPKPPRPRDVPRGLARSA